MSRCLFHPLQVQSQAPDTPVHVRRALVRWTIALPYTMRCHLMDYKPGSGAAHVLCTTSGCFVLSLFAPRQVWRVLQGRQLQRARECEVGKQNHNEYRRTANYCSSWACCLGIVGVCGGYRHRYNSSRAAMISSPTVAHKQCSTTPAGFFYLISKK